MWSKLLDSTKRLEFLLNAYRAEPSLADGRVTAVEMETSRGRLALTFALGTFPEQPPEAWAVGNTAAVTFEFLGLRDLELLVVDPDGSSSMDIQRQDGQLRVDIRGGVRLKFKPDAALVSRLSVYSMPPRK